ncbi:MAG: hypothetical protein WC579_01530 [Candidatus Paceibacterota bacterium]
MTHKTDGNHKYIMNYLKQFGISVADTSKIGFGFPDIVCGYQGKNYLFEIKISEKSKLNQNEEKFLASWRGQYHVITTPQEALEIIGIKHK